MSASLPGKPIDELFKPFIDDGQLNRNGLSIDPTDSVAVQSARDTFLTLYASVHTMLFHATSAERAPAWSIDPNNGHSINGVITNRDADLTDYALFLGVIRHCVIMHEGNLEEIKPNASSLSALNLIYQLSDSDLILRQVPRQQNNDQPHGAPHAEPESNQVQA